VDIYPEEIYRKLEAHMSLYSPAGKEGLIFYYSIYTTLTPPELASNRPQFIHWYKIEFSNMYHNAT
jgi:hypothetical protein